MTSSLSPRDLRAARRALSVPLKGCTITVCRTSPQSSMVFVTYSTPVGDQVSRAPRGIGAFRAACAHLGLVSPLVRRLVIHEHSVNVYGYGGSAAPREVLDAWPPRHAYLRGLLTRGQS